MVFKNFGKKRILAAALAMLLLLTAAFTSCGKKNFDDPAEHYKYVEEQSIGNGIEKVSAVYEAVRNSTKNTGNSNGHASIDIDLSEEALNMIELLAGGEIDLSWLSNIGIESDMYFDGELYGMDLSLLLGDSQITSLNMVMDYVVGIIYLSAPDILTKVLTLNYSELTGADPAATMSSLESLPEGKTVSSLLEKYIDMILGGIENVERAEGTLAANGVEQACTVITVTVTEEDAARIATSVLETARADEELKNVIFAFGDFLSETEMNASGYSSTDGEALYESFVSEVDYLLEDLADTSDAEGESDDIVLINYVNSDNEIIGRTLKAGEDEIISYAMARSGKDFGFELGVEGENIIVGSGTEDKTVNGTFTVCNEGTDYVSITLTDIASDYTKGTVDIEVFELPDIDGMEMLSSILSVYTLRISFDASAKNAWYELAVMNGENKFAAITLSSAVTDVEKPEIPAGEAIELGEDLDTDELLAALELDPLFENLNNSIVPGEYVNLLQFALAMVLQGQ